MADDIRTHVATDEYRSNWERIFGNKEDEKLPDLKGQDPAPAPTADECKTA